MDKTRITSSVIITVGSLLMARLFLQIASKATVDILNDIIDYAKASQS